jgi:phosphatidylserine decarboxylase
LASIPRHPIIAKEGWLFIIGSILVGILLQWFLGIWALPIWLFILLIINFFRDPIRVPTDQKDSILAPADGRIVAVEKTIDPYRHQDAIKISIFMNVFNVHTNRIPASGIIRHIQYDRGTFFNAAVAKSSLKNERNAVLIDMKNNTTLTVVQIAGLIARRILCYISVGNKVTQGQRYGFIRFGSRVDLYLPLTVKPQVAIGDKVIGAKTVVALL